MALPAFGAFTGGLNIRSLPFLKLFGAPSFRAHMLGERRLYAMDAARCCLIKAFLFLIELSVVMRGLNPRIHLFEKDGLPGHRRAKRRRSSNGYARQ